MASKVAFHTYLPSLLFLGFFFPNTRLAPLDVQMLLGRWLMLFLITGSILVYAVYREKEGTFGRLSSIQFLFILSFSWLGTSIIESMNPVLSLVKWLAFLAFLVFCGTYSALLRTREDLIRTFSPLMWVFVGIIWITPVSTRYFPQTLQSTLGYINGFFVFAGALGHFMAAFGIPAVLYLLNLPGGWKRKIFLACTLFLGAGLTVSSGSRTGTAISFFMLGIALWRWKRGGRNSFLKITFFCGMLLILSSASHLKDRVTDYLMKYPEEEDVMASRSGVWEKTLEAFRERRLFGFGFGVQEQHADTPLAVFSIGVREQGSTYYGLLEEVGLLGSLPMFGILLFTGFQALLALFQSRDPLELFFARIILAGLALAAVENYLLYLGNATSILVILALFMRERQAKMNRRRARAPWGEFSGGSDSVAHG